MLPNSDLHVGDFWGLLKAKVSQDGWEADLEQQLKNRSKKMIMGAELGGHTRHHGDDQDESAKSSWSPQSFCGPESPCIVTG